MFKSVSRKVVLGAVAAMVLSTPAFAQSADWTKQIAKIIAAKQTYPKSAQDHNEEGTARVKVYVGATGTVERTELVATSGSAALDREALIAPTRAGTLPAPAGGATAVVLPFTWKLL
jgi:protein TonB